MKWCLFFGLFFLSYFLVFSPMVWAAEFEITRIGTLNVEGEDLDEVTYTSKNVTFMGTASASATVSVTIDSLTKTTTATTLGNWTHSTTLAEGDHDLIFSSGGEVISFTLTVDEPATATDSATPATTPSAGNGLPTILITTTGAMITVTGVYFLRKNYLRV